MKKYRLTWFNRYHQEPEKKCGAWENDRQVVIKQMREEREKYPTNIYSIEVSAHET
jgi:hypothetical protein